MLDKFWKFWFELRIRNFIKLSALFELKIYSKRCFHDPQLSLSKVELILWISCTYLSFFARLKKVNVRSLAITQLLKDNKIILPFLLSHTLSFTNNELNARIESRRDDGNLGEEECSRVDLATIDDAAAARLRVSSSSFVLFIFYHLDG